MSSNLPERWPEQHEEDRDDQLDLSLSMSLATNCEARCGSISVNRGHQHPGVFVSSKWLGDVMHPWSLAARQEKAAIEKMRAPASAVAVARRASPSSSSTSVGIRVVPTVGWPPVRYHRRNVLGSYSPKSQIEHNKSEEKDAKKLKPSENEIVVANKEERNPTKFVKVNIQGFAIGRKIDLMDQDGYDSLSRALYRIFDNFLTVVKKEEIDVSVGDEHKGIGTHELVLLYEDNEGDRLLVGDVPWEMFIGSVKRLYISRHLKVCHQGGEEERK